LLWLKDHCELSERTAYNYMLVATHRGRFAIDANLSLAQALKQIRRSGNGDDGKGGPVSLYDRAQATLIKKLGGLLPDDVEAAARRTIAELETAIAAAKRPGKCLRTSWRSLGGQHHRECRRRARPDEARHERTKV